MDGPAVRVGLFLYDGVDLLDVGGPYEVFLTANRLALRRDDTEPFEVSTVGAAESAVTSYGGMGLIPQAGAAAAARLDVLLIPGTIDIDRASADEQLLATIRSLAGAASVVGSVCTGSFLLAHAGLVGGRTVTTHHEDVPLLREVLGEHAVRTARWVDEGALVTAGGLSSGIAMALHLVDRFTSRELATATAAQLAYTWNPDADTF